MYSYSTCLWWSSDMVGNLVVFPAQALSVCWCNKTCHAMLVNYAPCWMCRLLQIFQDQLGLGFILTTWLLLFVATTWLWFQCIKYAEKVTLNKHVEMSLSTSMGKRSLIACWRISLCMDDYSALTTATIYSGLTVYCIYSVITQHRNLICRAT